MVGETRGIICSPPPIRDIAGTDGILELRDNRRREREVRALTTAMHETGIKHGTIVSLDTEERIETDAGVIDVIPAWLWSVQQQDCETKTVSR